MWEQSVRKNKSGAADHRGIVRTFSSQNQTETGCLPYVPASLVIQFNAPSVIVCVVISNSHVWLNSKEKINNTFSICAHLSAQRGSWGPGAKGKVKLSGHREQLWPRVELRSAGNTLMSSGHKHDKT